MWFNTFKDNDQTGHVPLLHIIQQPVIWDFQLASYIWLNNVQITPVPWISFLRPYIICIIYYGASYKIRIKWIWKWMFFRSISGQMWHEKIIYWMTDQNYGSSLWLHVAPDLTFEGFCEVAPLTATAQAAVGFTSGFWIKVELAPFCGFVHKEG